MFDVGFWEMVLVGIVALLVFGPERLPRVARETALWIRKARSMVASVKHDIDHELQLYELRESLRQEKKALGAALEPDEPHAATSVRRSEERDEADPKSHDETNRRSAGR